MNKKIIKALNCLTIALSVCRGAQGQIPTSMENSLNNPPLIKPGNPGPDVTRTPYLLNSNNEENQDRNTALAELTKRVKELKARDSSVIRFASDLFDVPIKTVASAEGAISDDYVLGPGDKLNVYIFGAATLESPAQVDGKGDIVIPRIGSIKVSGLTLASAKAALEGLVARSFAHARVDIQVVNLRQVQVFVLGDVYCPGAYLVPSLSSVVNILSLSGGPTSLGSYRRIQVIRAGKVLQKIDLYPLRTEGLGNINLSFRSGDIIFVPIAGGRILLKGAFERLAHLPSVQTTDADLDPEAESIAKKEAAIAKKEASAAGKSLNGENPWSNPGLQKLPDWISDMDDGKHEPPVMQFEFLPGEMVADAVRWAGGLVVEAFSSTINLQRRDPRGSLQLREISLETRAADSYPLQKGDVLTAFIRRERLDQVVSLSGWARVPGTFSRNPGLKVGRLLARDNQVLPDTYLARGEIRRTLPDGKNKYLTFDVGQALKGDPANDLLLENMDNVVLFKKDVVRATETVRVLGPVAHPGPFPYAEGMRAADLLFRAGIPLKEANHLVGELARPKDGASQIFSLDLTKLLSTETESPVALKDDVLNPLLMPDDQISIFSSPDFKIHRTVEVLGQVARPGMYALDNRNETLGALLKRAGGTTPDAMIRGGMLIRKVDTENKVIAEKLKAADVSKSGSVSTLAVADILDRLNETTRDKEGRLQRNPILHGLASGKLNRMVVDFESILKGNKDADLELRDGDEILIPSRVDAAYVVGETASPFGSFKVEPGMTVRQLLAKAGGFTRNADKSNVRLLKVDGHIWDTWVMGRAVEVGDTVLVPQHVRRDSTWQENLTALTPVAIMLNTLLK